MDVELTELEKLEVTRVDAVSRPANGFPVLMMKGLAPAAKADGMTHPPFTGTHSHPHAANGAQREDDAHEHSHAHDGDADHGHSHAAKSALDIAVKAVTDGKIDQGPDVALGHQIMQLLAQAIANEAAEIGAGSYGETCDVDLLNCAASMISRWTGREAAPGSDDGDDMGMLMASAAVKAAEALKSPWEYPAGELAKEGRTFSADERKKHAAEGNALPDGSYPVPDADALRRAAVLARSKHGDWQAAEKLIARRAKELGVANPLAAKDDTSKSQVAPEGEAVDTVTQGTGDLTEIVKATAEKAAEPLVKRIAELESVNKSLEVRLAKVEAAPVPGGPVLSRNVQVKTPDGVVREDQAAKAAYYREMAETVTDRVSADGYRQLAREADAKAAPQA